MPAGIEVMSNSIGSSFALTTTALDLRTHARDKTIHRCFQHRDHFSESIPTAVVRVRHIIVIARVVKVPHEDDSFSRRTARDDVADVRTVHADKEVVVCEVRRTKPTRAPLHRISRLAQRIRGAMVRIFTLVPIARSR